MSLQNLPLMRFVATCRCAFFFIVCGIATNAIAGPPLVIDDTGILNPGGLEIILGVDGAKTDAVRVYDLPVLDVSLGLTENIQVSAVVSHQKVDAPGERSKSDWGYGEFGVKWRFYKNDTMQVAFAPAYVVPTSYTSTIRGVIDDVRFVNLPLLANWQFGDWTLMTQVAYAVSSKSGNGWDYGIGGGYQLTDKLQFLAEVYGATGNRASQTDTNYNFGFDYAFTNQFHVLASARSKLFSDIPGEDRLKYGYFIALQWFTHP